MRPRPMYLLSSQADRSLFPPVDQATEEGLLAIGGDLSPERLLQAYRLGIFPWYSEGQPILWWSPDPRAVLYPSKLKISRSLTKTLRKGVYTITYDLAFSNVIRNCAAPRSADVTEGTWITSDMIRAYTHLHELGYAHSVETWRDGKLVGGLYGLALGHGFFGESMFSRSSDASKVALVGLVHYLQQYCFEFVDCQLPSPHIMRLGAEAVPRARFLTELQNTLKHPDMVGSWNQGTKSYVHTEQLTGAGPEYQ